jgi:hypothetical protein
MSRIPDHVLAGALASIRAMDLKQKEDLADELVRAQPHVFASFLVQQKFGVSLAKRDFLLDNFYPYRQNRPATSSHYLIEVTTNRMCFSVA